jgi:hypothetical protein
MVFLPAVFALRSAGFRAAEGFSGVFANNCERPIGNLQPHEGLTPAPPVATLHLQFT